MKLKMLNFGYQYITNKQVKIVVDFAIMNGNNTLKHFRKTATARLKHPDRNDFKVGLNVARAKAEKAAFKEFMNFSKSKIKEYSKLLDDAQKSFEKAEKEYNSQIKFIRSI